MKCKKDRARVEGNEALCLLIRVRVVDVSLQETSHNVRPSQCAGKLLGSNRATNKSFPTGRAQPGGLAHCSHLHSNEHRGVYLATRRREGREGGIDMFLLVKAITLPPTYLPST